MNSLFYGVLKIVCSLFWCYIVCPICLEKPRNPVKLPCCQQILCKACSDRAFQASPYCPVCRKPQRAVTGNQPGDATMNRSENYGMCWVFSGYCCGDCHKSSQFLVDSLVKTFAGACQIFCTVDQFTKMFVCLSSCKRFEINFCTFAFSPKIFKQVNSLVYINSFASSYCFRITLSKFKFYRLLNPRVIR